MPTRSPAGTCCRMVPMDVQLLRDLEQHVAAELAEYSDAWRAARRVDRRAQLAGALTVDDDITYADLSQAFERASGREVLHRVHQLGVQRRFLAAVSVDDRLPVRRREVQVVGIAKGLGRRAIGRKRQDGSRRQCREA